MQSTQIAVRLPNDVLERLDERIPEEFPSRAAAVRSALEALLTRPTREQLERRHRDAWAAAPLSKAGEATLLADARALIAEEPW